MKVALRKMNKKIFRIRFNANIDNSKELFKYLLTFKIVIEYLDENDDIEKVFCFLFGWFYLTRQKGILAYLRL
ncbi:hypothetical protein [Clostridium estertheticum]|uniref:hypothetical protein n=1 Tax=Clostridium estertheticum TaxID=238834 RepID=UPI001C0CA193|nr:hypothetical protein [Clostridium estertheticum]MBU3174637.1 hypothetical protein [Clostridium estertheticum]MBU3187905.1 hypothetical protein [Clostridium estertheticum]